MKASRSAGLCLLLLLLAMPARGQAAASGTGCPPGTLDIEYLEERTTAVFALPAQQCASTQELGRVRVHLHLRRSPLAFGIERSAVTSHCDPFRICEVRLALDHPPLEAGVTYEADAVWRSTGPGPHRVLGAAKASTWCTMGTRAGAVCGPPPSAINGQAAVLGGPVLLNVTPAAK